MSRDTPTTRKRISISPNIFRAWHPFWVEVVRHDGKSATIASLGIDVCRDDDGKRQLQYWADLDVTQ